MITINTNRAERPTNNSLIVSNYHFVYIFAMDAEACWPDIIARLTDQSLADQCCGVLQKACIIAAWRTVSINYNKGSICPALITYIKKWTTAPKAA